MTVGIVKDKVLTNGVTGNFWKITSGTFNLLTGTITVTISLYLNQASFLAGKSSLLSDKVYELNVTSLELQGDLRELVWAKVIARAAEIVSTDILGNEIEPQAYDTDLDGGSIIQI